MSLRTFLLVPAVLSLAACSPSEAPPAAAPAEAPKAAEPAPAPAEPKPSGASVAPGEAKVQVRSYAAEDDPSGGEWIQWGRNGTKNMVSPAKNISIDVTSGEVDDKGEIVGAKG